MLDRRCMLAAGAALLLPTGRFPASAQVVARIGADAAGVTVLSDGGFEMPAAMLARDIDIAQVRDAGIDVVVADDSTASGRNHSA